MPARLGARPGARRGRPRKPTTPSRRSSTSRSATRPAARGHFLDRRRPPDRQAPRRGPHRRRGAGARGRSATPCATSIGRCLYGVDVNPMAVELCKVSLWMEALEPGQAALASSTTTSSAATACSARRRRCCADGIPDDAFKPIEGDDKAIATRAEEAEQEGARARPGRGSRFDDADARRSSTASPSSAAELDAVADDDIAGGPRARSERFARPRALGRATEQAQLARRRLVRRLRLAQGRRARPPHHRTARLRAASATTRRASPRGPAARGRAARRRVPLLPLAPRVPRGLPRRRSRSERRLDGRLRRRARQPAVGAGQAPGEGVLRRPAPGDRRARRTPPRASG